MPLPRNPDATDLVILHAIAEVLLQRAVELCVAITSRKNFSPTLLATIGTACGPSRFIAVATDSYFIKAAVFI